MLDQSQQGGNRNFQPFREVLRSKKRFRICIENLIVKRSQTCFWYRLIVVFKLLFLQKYWLDFFPQGLNQKSLLLQEFSSKNQNLWYLQCHSDWPEMPESAVSLVMPHYSNSFFQLYLFVFFLQDVSRQVFTSGRLSVLYNNKFVLYIRTRFLIDWKWL